MMLQTHLGIVTSILVTSVALLAIALVGVRLLGFQVFTVLSDSWSRPIHKFAHLCEERAYKTSIR